VSSKLFLTIVSEEREGALCVEIKNPQKGCSLSQLLLESGAAMLEGKHLLMEDFEKRDKLRNNFII
jgi:hypothetical protein